MAIYCVNFGVNFIFQKFCQCKKNDKYKVWEAAYLYPDLSTAIVGKFDDGKLIVGREARLVGLDCDLGLLRPRCSSRNCDVRNKDVMSVLL